MAAASTSTTTTTRPSAPREERLVLKLVPRRKKGVQWTQDTVDNEGLGRKSSKKCCIFHKQRQPGELSDSEDSDDDCDDPDCGKDPLDPLDPLGDPDDKGKLPA